jgi:hypothetical protein
MKNYKTLASKAGFEVCPSRTYPGKFFWTKMFIIETTKFYDSEDAAWKACCVENGIA